MGRLSRLPCPGGGDVNRDGAIDPLDALLILQYNAGLLPNLPAGAAGWEWWYERALATLLEFR